jgi:hypothetical protein
MSTETTGKNQIYIHFKKDIYNDLKVNLVAKCARTPYVDREVSPLSPFQTTTPLLLYTIQDLFRVPQEAALGPRQVQSSDKDERIFQFTVFSARHSSDVVTLPTHSPTGVLLYRSFRRSSERVPTQKGLDEVNLKPPLYASKGRVKKPTLLS